MTSLRSHIADVVSDWFDHASDWHNNPSSRIADALLADPTLAAILDLAAWYDAQPAQRQGWVFAPETSALLANWRAER